MFNDPWFYAGQFRDPHFKTLLNSKACDFIDKLFQKILENRKDEKPSAVVNTDSSKVKVLLDTQHLFYAINFIKILFYLLTLDS